MALRPLPQGSGDDLLGVGSGAAGQTEYGDGGGSAAQVPTDAETVVSIKPDPSTRR
jgi:hypothetical protein